MSDEGRLVRPHRSGGGGPPCSDPWHQYPNPFGCPTCNQRLKEPVQKLTRKARFGTETEKSMADSDGRICRSSP